jgi:hypothetical protein
MNLLNQMSYESLWGFRGLKLRPVKAEAVIKVLEGSFLLPGRKAVIPFCNILMEGVLLSLIIREKNLVEGC